ncbi:MAG TPA: hypothetical protein VGC55_14025 [Dokdonella sp.]
MNAFDAERFARLAHTLQASPRHLLVAAARLARLHEHTAPDTAQRRAIIDDAGRGTRAAEDAAALLLTPIASYAQDDTDRALASVWPTGG